MDEAEAQAAYSLQQAQSFYNQHTQHLPDIGIGSRVALQHPQTKMWDIYGTVIDIGPHRRYFIKTRSGRVLTRNHRFLRHRTVASLYPPAITPPQQLHQQSATVTPTAPVHAADTEDHQPLLRRSSRTHKPPGRLVEDPTWP